MRAFDDNALLQRRLGHSAYTGGPLEVHILRLDTSDAAELLVSLSGRQWGELWGCRDPLTSSISLSNFALALVLTNDRINLLGIGILLLEQPVVQLPGYQLSFVIQIVDISRPSV
jgi:hypothetical protein